MGIGRWGRGKKRERSRERRMGTGEKHRAESSGLKSRAFIAMFGEKALNIQSPTVQLPQRPDRPRLSQREICRSREEVTSK